MRGTIFQDFFGTVSITFLKKQGMRSSLVVVFMILVLTIMLWHNHGYKDNTHVSDISNAGNTIKVKDTEISSLIGQLKDEDPVLLDFIRKHIIEPPSLDSYNLKHPERLDNSAGQTPFIDNRLNFRTNGFFVECGALDGEKGSTTLFLERTRNWTGLLIEADPDSYDKLKLKNRKAYTAKACLSPKHGSAKMVFNKAFVLGRLIHDKHSKAWIKNHGIKKNLVDTLCFPFYSFMLAMNRTSIDFFTLDVEGDELNVLKTIPFDKLTIKMLTVEYTHVPSKIKAIREFMERKGYETLLTLQDGKGWMEDIIFKLKKPR